MNDSFCVFFPHGEIELPINLWAEEMVREVRNGKLLYVDQRPESA